jgi:hypothetical protein
LSWTIAFTGSGLSYLRDIPTLRELNIRSNAFTAEGLASLKFLPKLETIYIDDIRNRAGNLTFEMMAHIKHLTSLKHLSWTGYNDSQLTGHPTDASLMYLHGLEHLESFKLRFCQEITTEGLLDLAHTCKSLKQLEISYCTSIDEEGVKALRAKGLNVVFVDWTFPPYIYSGSDEDEEDEEGEDEEEGEEAP